MEPIYDEEDLLPLSGLAHMAFCERRWALIHVEGQWQENRYTLEGSQSHERAHSGELESRPGLLIRRALPLRSLRLGLSGQSDVVEFFLSTEEHAVSLPGVAGRWQPLPIGYKRSRDKAGSIAYRLQLCAQAMCLEEMLGTYVPAGAVYDVSTRRRQPVVFAAAVRQEVLRLAARMHIMRRCGETPAVLQKPACAKCSLKEVCVPELNASTTGSVARYLRAAVRQAGE